MSWMSHSSASCLHSRILAHKASPVWAVAHLMEGRKKEMVNDKLALKVPILIKLTKARHIAIPDFFRTGMCNSPTRRGSDYF